MKNPLKRLPVVLLKATDSALQRARFRNLRLQHKFGAFSSVPFPVLNKTRTGLRLKKGAHAFKKLEVIAERMPTGVRSVVDIGSNNGFFAIHLALRGYDVLGYEPVAGFVHGANQICEQFGVTNAVFITRGLDVTTSAEIFAGDVTLVLSVLHNWVKQYSFNDSKQILENIWNKTRVAMFFELANTIDNSYIAGFDTMPQMGTTTEECGAFIEREFLSRLPNSRVEFVGMMPTDYVNGSARHLFIVHKTQ